MSRKDRKFQRILVALWGSTWSESWNKFGIPYRARTLGAHEFMSSGITKGSWAYVAVGSTRGSLAYATGAAYSTGAAYVTEEARIKYMAKP